MSGLDERFYSIPRVEAAGVTQYSASASGTTDVSEAKVSVPSKPPAGLTYEVNMVGTISGGNAASTIHLKLGATQHTFTAGAVTAGEYVFQAILRITDSTNQKIMGYFLVDNVAVEAQYIAGTVDLSSGVDLVVQITSNNAGDTITSEMCIVKSWVK